MKSCWLALEIHYCHTLLHTYNTTVASPAQTPQFRYAIPGIACCWRITNQTQVINHCRGPYLLQHHKNRLQNVALKQLLACTCPSLAHAYLIEKSPLSWKYGASTTTKAQSFTSQENQHSRLLLSPPPQLPQQAVSSSHLPAALHPNVLLPSPSPAAPPLPPPPPLHPPPHPT